MGECDVLSFLSGRRGEWFSYRVIADCLGLSISSVSKSLFMLRKYGEVRFRVVLVGGHRVFFYSFKC